MPFLYYCTNINKNIYEICMPIVSKFHQSFIKIGAVVKEWGHF